MDPAPARTDRRIKAIAVSRGIGIGRLVFLNTSPYDISKKTISSDEAGRELDRFRSAVGVVKADRTAAPDSSAAELLEVEDMILDRLAEDIEATIRAELVNAEWAVKQVAEGYRDLQFSVSVPQFREKALEIEDAARRVVGALTGASSDVGAVFDAIVIARELRPSTMLELAKNRPAAIIMSHAGWTSHSAILAREFGLPMVSGVDAGQHKLTPDNLVIVDAVNGEVIVEPKLSTLELYRGKSFEREMRPIDRSVARDNVVTRDGVEIFIRANVDSVDAYRNARRAGAVGIGLYRSESLLERRGKLPSEAEQERAYAAIGEAVDQDSVSIRTFDIAIDFFRSGRAERNPALGLRAVRLSLLRKRDFRTQIRAILMAAAGRNIDLIVPMISGVDEVLTVREMIDSERTALEEDGREPGDPRLGVMIEVPSAVLTASAIAQEVDFLCLGTNDLVQYLLAVDRDNDAIAESYKSLHPAVLTAIESIVGAGMQAEKPVVVCGEMAGSPFYVPLLMGMGATELSMNINSVRPVRHLIAGISVEECRRLFAGASLLKTAGDIERFLRDHYQTYWEELFPIGVLNTQHQ